MCRLERVARHCRFCQKGQKVRIRLKRWGSRRDPNTWEKIRLIKRRSGRKGPYVGIVQGPNKICRVIKNKWQLNRPYGHPISRCIQPIVQIKSTNDHRELSCNINGREFTYLRPQISLDNPQKSDPTKKPTAIARERNGGLNWYSASTGKRMFPTMALSTGSESSYT